MSDFKQFTPCFILESELARYGLPSSSCQANIMQLVMTASMLIDEECGRLDSDGNGSLAFTTYAHKSYLSNRNRNLIQSPVKPLTAVSQTQINAATGALTSITGGLAGLNPYYSGVQANTAIGFDGMLSPIVSMSGRYGYPRQDFAVGYPDFFSVLNPLTLVSIFGGPAPWVPIDLGQVSIDKKTGEIWVPAGLQLQSYSELLVVYNTGFDPMNMHPTIKAATAMVVANMIQRPSTGVLSINLKLSGLNTTYSQDLIDPVIKKMLAFCTNTIMV